MINNFLDNMKRKNYQSKKLRFYQKKIYNYSKQFNNKILKLNSCLNKINSFKLKNKIKLFSMMKFKVIMIF